jgi:hypothetical protein
MHELPKEFIEARAYVYAEADAANRAICRQPSSQGRRALKTPIHRK